MKLVDKIKNQEKMVTEMNHLIDNLIDGKVIVESRAILQLLLKHPAGRYILQKLGKSISSDVDNENIDTKGVESGDVIKADDIKDVIDNADVKDIDDASGTQLEKIKRDLEDLIDKQLELVKKYNKKGFAKITITFNAPIPFKIKRGNHKGTKLKLEKTKRYDVHEITKEKTKFNRKGDYKIYFTYKKWLREYDIMFSLIQENIVKDVKKGNTIINIVYVDRSKGVEEIRIISEDILTKRAVIEIDSVK